MNAQKFFKIVLSVGVGLVFASLLIFLIGDIDFSKTIVKKRGHNYSRVANVSKSVMRKAIISTRVSNSKNNRYLSLANYPVVKNDVVHYPSIKRVRKLKESGKNLEINIKIKEMYDRGYTSNTGNKFKGNRIPMIVYNSTSVDTGCVYNVVDKDLIISSNTLLMLKKNTFINGNLYIKNIDFLKLPEGLYVNGNIYVVNSKGLLINNNTFINGHIIVTGASSLRHMVDSIKIAGQVFIRS